MFANPQTERFILIVCVKSLDAIVQYMLTGKIGNHTAQQMCPEHHKAVSACLVKFGHPAE